MSAAISWSRHIYIYIYHRLDNTGLTYIVLSPSMACIFACKYVRCQPVALLFLLWLPWRLFIALNLSKRSVNEQNVRRGVWQFDVEQWSKAEVSKQMLWGCLWIWNAMNWPRHLLRCSYSWGKLRNCTTWLRMRVSKARASGWSAASRARSELQTIDILYIYIYMFSRLEFQCLASFHWLEYPWRSSDELEDTHQDELGIGMCFGYTGLDDTLELCRSHLVDFVNPMNE